MTINISLEEVKRCNSISFGPSFFVILVILSYILIRDYNFLIGYVESSAWLYGIKTNSYQIRKLDLDLYQI